LLVLTEASVDRLDNAGAGRTVRLPLWLSAGALNKAGGNSGYLTLSAQDRIFHLLRMELLPVEPGAGATRLRRGAV
jgi:hypothetical protein